MNNDLIKKLMEDKNIDTVILLGGSENFFYMSGIDEGGWEGSFLVIKPNKKGKFIITSPMEIGSVRYPKNIHICLCKTKADYERELKKLVGKRIGLDYSSLTKLQYTKLTRKLRKLCGNITFCDVSKAIVDARKIKTKEEVKRITEACKTAQRAIEKTLPAISKMKTELGVVAELEKRLKIAGCDTAFPTIVASAEGTRVPHYMPKGPLRKGLLLIDIGCKYKKYCSDISRTYVYGRVPPDVEKIYETVYNAQRAVIDKAKEGVSFKALQSIAEKSLGEKMIHGIGHAVGLSVHEPTDDVLKKGMIITIEPALYFKRGGIRIEDVVLIRKDKCGLLSKPAKAYLEKI